jgi:hypothetical protein
MNIQAIMEKNLTRVVELSTNNKVKQVKKRSA